uniref:Uncharacterized protein n=1 Tax=uncultured prokaryote TaxID=198431 RepID=A0A0H5QK13_9ZZZZ|nr:hypothetical protein [uncultured prokaryote]
MPTRMKAVVYGTLASGAQGWSVGINLAGPSGYPIGDPAINVAAQQLYADFLSAGWNTATTGALALASLAGTEAKVDGVRLYGYEGSASIAAVVGQSTGASVPGTGPTVMPPQVCLVATLLTGFAGRALNGRIYLPNQTGSMQTTGQTTRNVAQVAVSVANWLSLWRTRSYAGSPLTPVVLSSTAGLNDIQAVRVDNVLDTQRRRRDKVRPNLTGRAGLVVG